MLRPWTGQVEKAGDNDQGKADSNNPLCPGATRGNGIVRIKKFIEKFVYKKI